MAKFRKIPVVIEAFQVCSGERPDWFKQAVDAGIAKVTEDGVFGQRVVIATLEGNMLANYDDYVIRGVKGELYPCKPGIFKATYEDASTADVLAED